MRHKGSVSQVNKKRNETLLSLFSKAKNKVSWPADMKKICRVMADMPVGEFYISDEAATVYAWQRFYHGQRKRFKSRRRQRLYDAFYQKVLELKRKPEYKESPISTIATIALLQPAPCIGLEPSFIYTILLKERGKLK